MSWWCSAAENIDAICEDVKMTALSQEIAENVACYLRGRVLCRALELVLYDDAMTSLPTTGLAHNLKVRPSQLSAALVNQARCRE